MQPSKLFSAPNNGVVQEPVVLIIGDNVADLSLYAFVSLTGNSTIINAADIELPSNNVVGDFNSKTTVEEINEFLKKNNYVVSTIISLPTNNIEQVPLRGIVSGKFVGDTVAHECILVDVNECVNSTRTIVSTTRTPGGGKSVGIHYQEALDMGFKVAHVYCYKGSVHTPDSLINKATQHIKERYSRQSSSRMLSLLANPYDVVEILGDSQFSKYEVE